MFKDTGKAAYDSAVKTIWLKIHNDASKLTDLVQKFGMKISFNFDKLCLQPCYMTTSFVRQFGFYKDQYEVILSGKYALKIRNSLYELEQRGATFEECQFIGDSAFDSWGSFYKKILTNLVLITNYICEQNSIPRQYVQVYLGGDMEIDRIQIDDPKLGYREFAFRISTSCNGEITTKLDLKNSFFHEVAYGATQMAGWMDSEDEGGQILDSNGLIKKAQDLITFFSESLT